MAQGPLDAGGRLVALDDIRRWGCYRNGPLRGLRVLVKAVIATAVALHSTRAEADSSLSVSEQLEAAERMQSRGDNEAALESLKRGIEADPASEELAIALAQAYLRVGNPSWAKRALSRFAEANQGSCNVRLQLARLELKEGQLSRSRMWLEGNNCDVSPELRARRMLLEAYLELLEDRPALAMVLLDQARSSSRLFEEDLRLLNYLTAKTEPERIPKVIGVVDLASGWTSQGLAGSPLDQATRRASGSALTVLDAQLRYAFRNSGGIRPLAEGQVRAQQLWSHETSELSYRTGTGRLGVLFGKKAPLVQAMATLDATQTQGGDRYEKGPQWFSEAGRGELEIELPSSVFIVTGLGHRTFRELSRSRTELDGTIGWGTQQPGRVQTLAAISARYHDAKRDAFDLFGVTTLAQVRLLLPLDIHTNATLSVAGDAFYRSRGAFSDDELSTRRDAKLRATLAIYSPRFWQMRLVGRYELTLRRSSAAAYEYTDHRLLAAVEWRVNSDQLGVRRIGSEGRAVVDYSDIGELQDASNLQIRELIRQEETQRRGSTCQK